MYVINISNLKGGVGKSTVTINIANGLIKREIKTAIIDLDEQATSFMWSHVKSDCPIKVIQANNKTLQKELSNLSDYDVILLDNPPQVKNTAIESLKLSNMVIVPMTPSVTDYWATDSYVKLVNQQIEHEPNFKGAILLNRVKSVSSFTNEVKVALQDINLPIMKSIIYDRIAYVKSLSDGVSIFESKDEKGKSDILNLIDELETML